ncbi:hypothetical protein FIV42_03390 [Persicimonas caeni]|uniref:Transporter n=1 Tax=Persicimonas caeni TaxID=2292766 RepID=A0A4Y6PPY1_PERCE|nr:hypothetical protein [Persicimonas caeni]QDG49815.1 hypothetical protein FIV42_03390 [Persicimonas caeni]QED31036.1 hypothetical protein FRD00_03385 [Persicimonas caeni]
MTDSTHARCRPGALLLGLLVGLTALASPALASAQACCTATGAGEFSVVGRCQDSVLATQLTYQRGAGSFSDDGDYRSLDHAQVNDLIVSVGGGFRPFHQRLQVYGSVPLRLQHRSFEATGSDLRLGPGDAAAAVRWTALQDSMGEISLDAPKSLVPFLDLYAGLKVPTGRAPEDTVATTGADITGDGAWQLMTGAKVSKFLDTKHVLGAQASYSHRLARTIEKPDGGTTDFAPAGEVDLQVSYLHIHDLFWSWGLNSSFKFAGETVADGEPVPDSETRRLRFGGHITHGFEFPFWEATLSVSADAWWNGASSNVPFVGPAASLTLRRQFL